ncbi:hypothetical protein K435DRAFT_860397 [Dendrothele bispora CBS 962.96]|uniref:Uncharacterized protein n=1 Tax=Dendrothele bispora (strain CBS 962.96) TaxID=1314807 RepID=A0A4S8LYF5_DENBC|nr:hypothetical protein K435DRAFT_860397 [Dendrothele bispora CBS 962.96]
MSDDGSARIYFRQVRVITLEPGETVVLTLADSQRSAAVRSSVLYDIPGSPPEGYAFLASRQPVPAAASHPLFALDTPPSPVPSPVELGGASVPEEGDTGVQPTPTFDEAHHTEHAEPPPPYPVSPPPRAIPGGIVKVYAAFNRVPSPEEFSSYWPHGTHDRGYLVLEGCRIGFFPSWTLAQPFLHRVSNARHVHQKLAFSDAFRIYTNSYNRVPPFRYPAIAPVPRGADTSVINFNDEELQGDIEIAVDSHGRVYTFAMGSETSSRLNRFTIDANICPPIDIHDSDSEQDI